MLILIALLALDIVRTGLTDAAPYSCRRQAYKEQCAGGAKSQFVWRWYLDQGQCKSYPYGYCAGEEDIATDQAIRYQEDCEAYCIHGQKIISQERLLRGHLPDKQLGARDFRIRQAGYGGFSQPTEEATDKGGEHVEILGAQTPAPVEPVRAVNGDQTRPPSAGFSRPSGTVDRGGEHVEVLGASAPAQAPSAAATPFKANGGGRQPTKNGAATKSVAYSCERLAYREKCSTGLASQFTLRWHLYNGECISYPYGYCNGVDSIDTDPSIRYKEDCEAICIRGEKLKVIPGQRELKHFHHGPGHDAVKAPAFRVQFS